MNVIERDEKINILNIKKEEENNYICKICEEEVINKEEINNNKCEQCETYFCEECLYLHIKELIKNGKYALFCPECRNIYTKNKIEQIFMLSKDKEVKNLKKLLEKNKTKDVILNDPELMFCPIVNCDGFAKKNDKRDYNICNMGHKFCNKCGELWHQDEKCKEEENVDKLFQEFRKKYKLKNCPYCHIVVIKKGGCNHMKCQFCGKDWCWLCDEIFISTEEHYGNRNSKCFNKMMNNDERIICSKCDTEINGNFRTFDCDHIICNNCFIEYLLINDTMIIYPDKIINCTIIGCKGIWRVSGERFFEFVNQTNNEELIKKYKNSFLFFKYSLRPNFRFCTIYMESLFKFYALIAYLFNCCSKYKLLYTILEVIGIRPRPSASAVALLVPPSSSEVSAYIFAFS